MFKEVSKCMSEIKKRGPYKKKGDKDYISNEELTAKLVEYSRYFNKERERLSSLPENKNLSKKEIKELTLSRTKMSESLAKDIMTLARRICGKFNFSQYSYRDEMEQEAIFTMFKGASNFDEAYSNGFSYLTTVAHSGIINKIKSEKEESVGKDEMILNLGAEYLEDEYVGESLKKLQESASERMQKKEDNKNVKSTFRIKNRRGKKE